MPRRAPLSAPKAGSKTSALSRAGRGGTLHSDQLPNAAMSTTTFHLTLATLTFALAGLVKRVTGMGLPPVGMGLLGALLPPAVAASLLLVPSFVANLWRLLAGPGFVALARRLWGMRAGIVAGTVAGASLMTGDKALWAVAGLGATLALYAV